MFQFDGQANLVMSDEVFNVHVHARAFPRMTAHVYDHVVTHDIPSGTV